MSKKIVKPLNKIRIQIDILGNKVPLMDLCPTCFQEVKKSWTSCQYCEQPFTDEFDYKTDFKDLP